MPSYYFVRSHSIIQWIDRVFVAVALLALVSLVLEYGFYLSPQWHHILNRFELLVVEFYLVQYGLKLVLSRNKLLYLRNQWYETVLALLVFLETASAIRLIGINVISTYFYNINVRTLVEAYVVIAQFLIVLTLVPRVIQLNKSLTRLRFNPAQTSMLSFALIILIGALLLMLPRAVRPGNVIAFIDALFTSTSAICVTGLTVLDTGSYFSPIGQMIILFLVQIGGIGIITINSFLALFFGQGVGLQERIMLFDIVNAEKLSIITSTIRNIIIIVLATELIGALVLMMVWAEQGWSLQRLIFVAVFHSVCAFCNAGFSTFSENLMGWQSNAGVIVTIAMLIIIGGLGFNAIMDIMGNRLSMKRNRSPHLKVHTKLVMIVTVILIVAGTGAFLLFEPMAQGESIATHLLNAFFTSVTARTAGFNSVNTGALSETTAIVIIILMFIGASPQSTGGGIKTTTAAVLWCSVVSLVSGRRRIVLFRKNIPFVVLNRALIVFFVSTVVIIAAALLLSITEHSSFLNILFEVVSAFGTVGLSRGLTPDLTVFGKAVIIAVMFVGRIGILTLAFAITAPKEQQLRIEYPSELVAVG